VVGFERENGPSAIFSITGKEGNLSMNHEPGKQIEALACGWASEICAIQRSANKLAVIFAGNLAHHATIALGYYVNQLSHRHTTPAQAYAH
jgi:hypothetical protein